jgi:hypothetical protein
MTTPANRSYGKMAILVASGLRFVADKLVPPPKPLYSVRLRRSEDVLPYTEPLHDPE